MLFALQNLKFKLMNMSYLLDSIKYACTAQSKTYSHINLLKPDLLYVPLGLTFIYSMFCPQCIYVFCVDLRTNSDYFSL